MKKDQFEKLNSFLKKYHVLNEGSIDNPLIREFLKEVEEIKPLITEYMKYHETMPLVGEKVVFHEKHGTCLIQSKQFGFTTENDLTFDFVSLVTNKRESIKVPISECKPFGKATDLLYNKELK